MKKIIALVLTAMMVMSLAACGSSVDAGQLDDILATVQSLQAQVDALAENAAPAAEEPAAPAEEPAEAPAEEAPAEAGELAAKDGGSSLIFTTGGDQGTYYAFGGVMSQKVSEVTSTNVTAITSGGSQANIEALEMGDAQLGFTQSDVMAYAYDGTRLFEEPVGNFSVVASLYMEQVQIVTLDPDIQSVADLEGKNVSIGAAGSGVYFNAIDILEAYGLTEDDINPTYQSFGDSTEALQDGQIDAAFVVAGAPTTAVTSLAATQDVYLVSLDDEHIDQLTASSPYYSKYVIPADAYGTPNDVTTVAIGAVVIADDSVADADVYNFLYGVFENLDNLAHDKANELSLEFATSVTDVPYHPGAAAYFADKGIDVPVK